MILICPLLESRDQEAIERGRREKRRKGPYVSLFTSHRVLVAISRPSRACRRPGGKEKGGGGGGGEEKKKGGARSSASRLVSMVPSSWPSRDLAVAVAAGEGGEEGGGKGEKGKLQFLLFFNTGWLLRLATASGTSAAEEEKGGEGEKKVLVKHRRLIRPRTSRGSRAMTSLRGKERKETVETSPRAISSSRWNARKKGGGEKRRISMVALICCDLQTPAPGLESKREEREGKEKLSSVLRPPGRLDHLAAKKREEGLPSNSSIMFSKQVASER